MAAPAERGRVGSGVDRMKRKTSDLDPVKRGYFVGFDTKWEHSLSVQALVHGSPFVARSGVLVNIEKSVRL